ncbi:putative flavin-containing amine oxidoreductase family protein [Desulforapulum autotrophicum HRM2]|uniref:Flavin-containing amine oxidoreductase family protein n=1 Tax=Desulforapulum autotrophicum (strain ATCC 43914 / DSM 3382 / VKM B-1955 / HRM2) TaxID=177437 RepID=C0QK38_DESAH|nr:FAD-dependent oxidoreductase [Desulforapulum autotrophicum]ACN16064.1 putative flavin-containing amine oxidoreductase family protein [Desulforapulum autotrophicum HRM2]
MKILILGGGPCGLGAAWRLNETCHGDYLLCEAKEQIGGLSASFRDDEGFVWDIGGHVLFSHYGYFDAVMDSLLEESGGWLEHNREAWIWMQDRFVSYPLQNNIHQLPRDIYWDCLKGIIDIQNSALAEKPDNFGAWIDATFGKGLARWFLNPYNFKVWACTPDQMGVSWVGERVAPVDLKQVLKSALFQNEDTTWGPNSRFKFPRSGGTGAIWKRLMEKLPKDKIHLNKKAIGIDPKKRRVRFENGESESYDILINTMALTDLLKLIDLDQPFEKPSELRYSSTHVVGLALKGSPPDALATKCWIYFPEDNSPFYRVTVFSNYSPNNVPDSDNQWSLMCEVSESRDKKVDPSTIVADVIQGALNTKLIPDRSILDHTWYHHEKKGYPTPTPGRDPAVTPLLVHLEEMGIYSRGRFGAWKYEVGNMDHSFMQGVECVNHLTCSAEEMTLWYPNAVNSAHPSGRKV